jgi:hypothetical protein
MVMAEQELTIVFPAPRPWQNCISSAIMELKKGILAELHFVMK